MGNATKALVIAGGILVSVLVISLCMYMYASFKNAYEDNMQVLGSVQKEAFNSFFYGYSSQIKGWEAYNIIGKINDINEDPDSYTTVHLDGDIDGNNYKTDTFYFTEAFENDYKYLYKDNDGDGLIDYVSITI